MPRPEGGPQVFAVSRAVIDRTAQVPQGVDLPRDIQDMPIGPKISVSQQEFSRLEAELIDRDVEFASTVGGNSINAAHRLKEIPRDPGLVVVRTWVGSDGYRTLMEEDLNHPGMQPDLVDYDGQTSKALVIPRQKPNGEWDRTIISNRPQGLPSEFASAIPDGTDYALLNSLGGDDWPTSLMDGAVMLNRSNIPYAYTPGSAQLTAVTSGEDPLKSLAVYRTIAGATSLNVNKEELGELLTGLGVKPEERIEGLLEQGIQLGAQTIFVTDGENGAYGASQDGEMVRVGLTRADRVVSLAGAGDAAMAGSVYRLHETKGDLVDALKWGSASGSYAVEHVGAHEAPPTRAQIENRLADPHKAPEVEILRGKRQSVVDVYVA
jgi:sugar/nucleoside kinase (ribokinase family)